MLQIDRKRPADVSSFSQSKRTFSQDARLKTSDAAQTSKPALSRDSLSAPIAPAQLDISTKRSTSMSVCRVGPQSHHMLECNFIRVSACRSVVIDSMIPTALEAALAEEEVEQEKELLSCPSVLCGSISRTARIKVLKRDIRAK